jgi:ribosome biogenesis GTPase / thiamine phosphate phosphatase
VPLNTGLVVGAHGRHFVVETPERQRLLCHRRGKKGDCVVGDHVEWKPTGDGGVIEAVLPRRSLLWRQDRWRSKSFAANIDRLIMLVAATPPVSESMLARALVAAGHADIPAHILFNKVDLPEADAARQRLEPYRRMGVPVLEVSLKRDAANARAVLAPLVSQGVTLLLGASGVGKSTLINTLVPDAAAQVGDLSMALNAGRHTTTTTSWYWLDASHEAAVLDSPGFQEFGLLQVPPERLAGLLPDIAAFTGACRFINCTHRSEPDCAVRDAAARGEVAAGRLRFYQELYDELSQPRW